jgi:hypothetical protein
LITADGGSQPTWRGGEKELFFLAPGGRMMSVSIDTTGGVLKPGVPVHLFDASLRLSSGCRGQLAERSGTEMIPRRSISELIC